MDYENPVYRLPELPDRLENAERRAEKGVKENNIEYFESAFTILQHSWADILRADKKLDRSYNAELSEDDLEPVSEPSLFYGVYLDELGEDSHPAAIGMALPGYFEMVQQTEEYLLDRFQELDA